MARGRNARVDLGVGRALPAFFYGKWRLDVRIVDAAWECVSCMRVYAQLVPRIKYGSQIGSGAT